MTNSLIEKITKVVMATRYGAPELIAKDVITAVLDHFSDPANVTNAIRRGWWSAFLALGVNPKQQDDTFPGQTIAAAMKAAKEELK